MDWKKLNVEIVIPDKIKKLMFLVFGTWICTAICVTLLDWLPLKLFRVFKLFAHFCMAIPAIIIFKKNGRKFKSLFEGNVIKQIIIGILIGIVLLGISAIKNGDIQWTIHTSLFSRYDWYKVYVSVYYLLIVGFAEEFTYRVVIQDYLIELLGKIKWLAPLLTAAIFSFGHIFVGGHFSQLMVAFVWGLIWGYLKFFNKNITYVSLSVSHGLYDYGLMFVPFILAKL